MDEKHRKLIKSYASYYYKDLYQYGLDYELEDLEGEFYLCYAKSLKLYNPEASDAKFETYLISAITNRFYDIRDRLISNSKMMNSYASDVSVVNHEPSIVDMDGIVDKVSKVASDVLSSKEYTIFKELISPSEKVSVIVSGESAGRTRTGKLYAAIAMVHGMTLPEVKYKIKLLRNKLRSNIDIMSIQHCFAN